jgi:putative membrane protein
MGCLIRILINIIAIAFTAWLLPGLEIGNGIWGVFVVAIIFGLVNGLVRPLVKLLTLPINIMTLGLFTLVINTAMLGLTSWFSGDFLNFTGSSILENTFTAFIAAIIISLISVLLDRILNRNKK